MGWSQACLQKLLPKGHKLPPRERSEVQKVDRVYKVWDSWLEYQTTIPIDIEQSFKKHRRGIGCGRGGIRM